MKERDEYYLIEIKALKEEYPSWGYRRAWAYLNYREGYKVGRNAVRRIMRENGLTVKKNDRLRALRTQRAKPRAERANEYWGIDMTKVKIGGFGWLYVHIVIDWWTKQIKGYEVSATSKRGDWEKAMEKAVNREYPEGIRNSEQRPRLVSDNGCQPTSLKFMEHMAILGIEQIFTSWNNPKGNAETERFMRTMKEHLFWTREYDNVFEFEESLKKFIEFYNEDYPHSKLKYQSPNHFYRTYCEQQDIPSHQSALTLTN